MNKVQTLNVNGITLEYIVKDDEIYILNTKNKRYILADYETLNFLKSYNYSEKNYEIDDYLYNKKINILDMKILNLKIKSSFIKKILNLLSIFFNKYTFILSLISIIFIPRILLEFKKFQTQDLNINNLILIFLIQFFIIIIHELGHLQEYSKNFKREYIFFGIQLRYFCLLMFYTDVSFFSILNKSEKIKIILAGIRNQMVLNFFLIILYYIYQKNIILLSITINSIIIITNCLPFMKLDGFWFINTLLNTENYMDDFIMCIKKKYKIKPIIVFLGILNIAIIICAFLGMFFTALSMFTLKINF